MEMEINLTKVELKLEELNMLRLEELGILQCRTLKVCCRSCFEGF